MPFLKQLDSFRSTFCNISNNLGAHMWLAFNKKIRLSTLMIINAFFSNNQAFSWSEFCNILKKFLVQPNLGAHVIATLQARRNIWGWLGFVQTLPKFENHFCKKKYSGNRMIQKINYLDIRFKFEILFLLSTNFKIVPPGLRLKSSDITFSQKVRFLLD